MEQQGKQTLMVRMDKNIVKQSLDFVSNYDRDSSIILDIVIFNAQKQQNNLFGYEDLEPHEFSELMGYNPKNLLKNNPNALWYKKKNIIDRDRSFTNYLENALYRMMMEPMEFSRTVYDRTLEVEKFQVKAYQLITGLEKHIYKRKDKFFYSYEFNNLLSEHINKFFTQIDVESLKRLRRHKAAFLYLLLIDQRDLLLSGKIKESTPYFDELCKNALLDYDEPSENMRYLNKKLDIIKEKTNLDFEVEPFKRSGKHKYGLRFYFKRTAEEKEPGQLVEDAFQNAIKISLIKIFREKYQQTGRLNIANFNKWLTDPCVDLEAKKNCYVVTYSDIKKIPIERSRKYCQTDSNSYFNVLTA